MRQKRTGRGRWLYGCGLAFLLGLCFLFVVTPVALRFAAYVFDNLPTATAVAVRPPASATPHFEGLGTFDVTADGGSFESGDLAIEVAPGAVNEAVTLDVSQTEPAAADEDQFYQSSEYRLEGPLALLNGDLTFTLRLPAEALSAVSDEGGEALDNLRVVLVQESFAPSAGGTVTSNVILPSEVDAEAGTIRATLSLALPAGMGRATRSLVSLDPFAPPPQAEETGAVSFKVEGRWCSTEAAGEHFLITYSGCAIEQALVEELAQMLEEQWTKLSDLGLSFAGGPQPISVTLEKFAVSAGGATRAGQYTASKWGAAYTSLSFNRSYFLTTAWSAAERADLQATAGHELFHLVQFLADPRNAFRKAVNPAPTLWLDEAAATWYEPIALDEPDFLPSNATSNSDFYRAPLYLAPLEQATDHGYGASLLLRYLTAQYDDSLISDAYNLLRAGVYSGTGAEALDKALDNRGSSMGLEWIPFLETYFTRPEDITSDFGGPNVNQVAALSAQSLPGTDDYTINFDFSKAAAGLQPVASPGTLLSGPDAIALFSFTLGDLSADALRLTFDVNKGDTRKALAAPGKVRVTVDAPEWAGVLVYGVTREGNAYVPLAGAPWSFLSSGDSASQSGAQLVVSDISHGEGNGTYKGLLLVPFQYRNASYTQAEPMLITVELAYLSAPLEATATPEPNPNVTSTDCAGLTPDDLHGYFVDQRILSCRLHCVPIGGEMPSDESLWACIEQNGGQRP